MIIDDNELEEICNDAENRGYNKAIDDLLEKAADTDMSDRDFDYLKSVAEQLKEGKNESSTKKDASERSSD